MNFTELRLKNFGKFIDESIELKEGINLIYGDNEAGKSTIHNFLTGMLFGIEKQRGRASKEDSYSKYQPWETPFNYGGSLDLSYQGKNYRIHRSFHKENREYIVIDLATGREISAPNIKGVAFIDGLTEENFKNTVSIEQLKARTEKDLAGEVRNHIANLSLSKSNQVDIGEAINHLNLKKKLLEGNQIKEKISSLEDEIKVEMQEEEKMEKLSFSIKQLETKLEQEKESHPKEEFERLDSYISLYPGMKEKYKQYIRLSEQKKSLEDSLKLGQKNTPKEIPKPATKPPQPTIKLLGKLICIIITIFISFGIILNKGINQVSILTILIGIILTWGVYHITKWLYHRNNANSSSILNSGLEGEIRLNSDANPEKERILKSIKEITTLIKEEEYNLLDYGSRICDFTTIDSTTMNQLEKEINSLKEITTLKKEESRKKNESIRIELERYKWELSVLEEKELGLFEKKVLLEELQRKLKDDEKEVKAISLAITTINNISSNIHDDFGQNLNEMLSNIMREQTNGKYEDIKVDEKLNIKVGIKDRFIELDRLSVGTIEQLYLALRLSVAKLIFKDEKMPLLFDDTFAYYDEERLKGALQILAKDKNRQILIFTCHKREERLLEVLHIPYHKIILTD